MKQQLQTVREVLERIRGYNNASLCGALNPLNNDTRVVSVEEADKALAALDAYIEGMKSEEMVERVAKTMHNAGHQDGIFNFGWNSLQEHVREKYLLITKAAINAIMGE